MMRQKIIMSESISDMTIQLDAALSYGWFIHQVVSNPNGHWLAILYRNE